jgi:hypothetical protein
LLNEFPQGIEENLKGIYRSSLNDSFTYIMAVQLLSISNDIEVIERMDLSFLF